ncbi:MAG TPA: hypothetical protein VEG34_17415 [Thermoanaerobaculia bacterium]|nr:hypothetical protein [Thermoanaerobaculia bacterium]
MIRRIETAAAVLLTMLAAALHVMRALHAGPLWRDEAGALQVALLPTFGEMFQRFPHEAFPLLFPTTVRTYVGLFGDSDFALRVFGSAVGIAILAALWLNARMAGTVPLASVALLGFHPAFLIYADTIRGYGLGTLLTLLAFGAFCRLVAQPDGGAITAAAVASILSVHLVLHNSAMVLGLGMAAAVVGALWRRWRVTAAALGVGLLAALTLLPYTGPLSAARDWDVLIAEGSLTAPQVLNSLVESIGSPILLLGWVLLLVLGVASLARREEEAGDVRLFRLLAIPAALAAQYGLFELLGYLPKIWYFLPLLALAASALDGLTAGLRAPRLALATGIALLLLPAASREARLRMSNVDLVASRLEANAAEGDLVLVNPWFYGVSFQRYYQGRARWMTVPSLPDHRMHRYDLLKARMAAAHPLADVLNAVRHTLRSGKSVWLVGSYTAPPEGELPPMLGPAPVGSLWGWRDAPYVASWGLQIGDVLKRRARHQRVVEVPLDGPVNGHEILGLRKLRGWRRLPES